MAAMTAPPEAGGSWGGGSGETPTGVGPSRELCPIGGGKGGAQHGGGIRDPQLCPPIYKSTHIGVPPPPCNPPISEPIAAPPM